MSTSCQTPTSSPTAAEVRITDHCVRRYIDRVKQGLGLDSARGELDQLKLVSTIATSAPFWTREANRAA